MQKRIKLLEEYVKLLKNALDILADNNLIKEDRSGKNEGINDILTNLANRGGEISKQLASLAKELKEEGKGAEETKELILSILKNSVQYDDGEMIHLTSQLEEISNVIVRSIQYASLPAKQSVTDEDIEKWAKGTIAKYKEVEIGVNLTDSDIRGFITHAKITGAKAHRDGLIKK